MVKTPKGALATKKAKSASKKPKAKKPKAKSSKKALTLGNKTIIELKEEAKKKSISLKGVTKKADIIKVLSSRSPPKIEKSKSQSLSPKGCPGGVCPVSKKSKMTSKKSSPKLTLDNGELDYKKLFFMAMKELVRETEHKFGIIMGEGTFEKMCFERDGVLRDWVGIAYKEDEAKILKSLKKEKDRYEFLDQWKYDLTVGGLDVSTVCHQDFVMLIPKSWTPKEVSKLESFYRVLKAKKYKVELGLLFKECSCT